MISANDPTLTSWVEVPEDSDFPIQNLPFGIFRTPQEAPRVGVAIGEYVLDLKALHVLGYIENLPFSQADFDTSSLNIIISHGKVATRELRNRISKLLRSDVPDLRDKEHHVKQALIPMASVEMLMPVEVGDYTDFYSSIEHATNVGKMFRDPENALLPNWKHIPVGYHGRASSIIVSGTPVHRPKGQMLPADAVAPVFGPCKLLDFELEMAFITYPGKPMGQSISTAEAENYIFGMVLFNDWSARDIQKWEYVPLGPFLGKSFASSISPWVVTLDALEPFKVSGPTQDPPVLPYLEFDGEKNYDISLEVGIAPEGADETVICKSNFKYMYWNLTQQLAHHSVNGCNIRGGDMMASGTISGADESAYGSMLELSWKGSRPVKLNNGEERKFINDGDTVKMRGYAQKGHLRIGFGGSEWQGAPRTLIHAMVERDTEAEKKEILRRYRGLLRAATRSRSPQDRRRIRKAFNLALEAHKEMRRKSGEPYIYHPIAVARICAEEVGLDTTSIVCALLHDTVEDTYITLDDIQNLFGKKERRIIDGLTKISGVFDQTSSMQAENFRKMLLTLSDDIRVILIKIADRLHNMRTLDHMAREKQLKIASETLFMYAPLAHRLGLYNIKTELEDLSLKYKEPEQYQEISAKLAKTKAVRTRFINKFAVPIRKALDAERIDYEIKGRTKSIFSIWSKMQKKQVRYEDIYDVFAIRIIVDTPIEQEKAEAWKVYSIVTDFYQPNPDRLRDWISIPKGNGYESLHTTVMSPTGKWVEVQIRSRRMDNIAEKGFAAHWRYKGDTESAEHNLDNWLAQIREVLESHEDDALAFIDDFKLNLFSEEIYIFTPNGDLKTLPKGAKALDFAFHIHSQVGSQCIGAKVNHKLVPLSHELRSGDQVEIIVSKKQTPKEDWLSYVVTARAKQKIKQALKEERKKVAAEGKDTLRRKFKNIGASFLSVNINALQDHYDVETATELYYRIAKGNIDIKKLKGFTVDGGRLSFKKRDASQQKRQDTKSVMAPVPGKKEVLLIGDEAQRMDYTLARCCNPIPGDDVFGFVTVNGEIKVHRVNCPNATQLLSNYAYRVIKTRWASKELEHFEVTVQFSGIDDVGLVQRITNIISSDMNVNMKAISFESNDGIFDGLVRVQVHDTEHLHVMIDKLRNVEGVLNVQRMEPGQMA